LFLASRRRRFVALAVALGLLAAVQNPAARAGADASVVNSASNGSSSARTSISVNRPPGTQAGHVMLASIVSNDDGPDFTAPAGWTPMRQLTVKDALRHNVYLKVAGVSEPASFTWKVSSSRRLAGGITSFAGVDAATPVDAVDGATNLSSKDVRAPGVTTTVPNTLLVHLAAVAAEGSLSAPSAMTETWQAQAFSSSNKKDVLASLSSAVQVAAGPTGDRIGAASRAGKSTGVLLALRPAVETTSTSTTSTTEPPTTTSTTEPVTTSTTSAPTTTTTTMPDTAPPETIIGSGPSGTATSTFATFEFSADEPASFLCQLDTGLPEACASPKTYVHLADGQHSFAVVATDAAGNPDPTPAVRQWAIVTSGEDPVIAGAGDISTCNTENDEATAKLLDDISPTQVFTLGDSVYAKGGPSKTITDTDFRDCYAWARHKDRTVPVTGNHDYVGSNAGPYFSYFGPAAGDPAKGYYDYRLGAWHVIVLNSNCADVGGCGAGTAQEQWLRGVLARSDADCTVALWHNPRFSSGSHGSDATYQPLWQALYDHGADVVLNGHDHVYEQFARQTPSGAADAAFGLHQFTVGTGGSWTSGFPGAAQPNSVVRDRSAAFGVLRLALHDDSYSWNFVPVAGQTFTDQGTAACHDAPATPPPPPPPPPGVGIAAVGATSNGASTSRATITIARPAEAVAGTVMVAAIGANEDTTISAPPGWTAVRQDVAATVRQSVYVKAAGPTEPSSYTWTLSGVRRVAGGITAYAGVDPANPVDAVDGSLNPSGTTVTSPGVTTTADGAMLVQLVTVNAEGTLSAPTGWDGAWEAASPNSKSTRDVLVGSSHARQPLAGPTGPALASADRPGISIGVMLALRPGG
jgi:hypothetical protein